MAPILRIAGMYHLHVIEDNAQSVGAEYTFPDGQVKKQGQWALSVRLRFSHPSRWPVLSDGGALMTSDESLAKRIRMIANHGQEVKYHHKLIGCNSRLDTLHAAVLDVEAEVYRRVYESPAGRCPKI